MEDKDYSVWLKRAKSNLELARNINKNFFEEYGGEICFEDACFELQQSAEKALKALLIYSGSDFPKTHDIAELIKLIKKHTTIEIPEQIKKAVRLTPYPVITRYPNFAKINEDKYKEALELADSVYGWVKKELTRE